MALRKELTAPRVEKPGGKRIGLKEFRTETLRLLVTQGKRGEKQSIERARKDAIKSFAGLASGLERQKGAADDLARVRSNLLGRRSTILSGGQPRAGLQPSNLFARAGTGTAPNRKRTLLTGKAKLDQDNLLGRQVFL
jgi:hypothetical protein